MALPLPLNIRRTALSTKLLIIHVVALTLFLAGLTRIFVFRAWRERVKVPSHYTDEIESSIEPSEWGRMALQIRWFANWAKLVMEDSYLDGESLMLAMVTRFPWLKGSQPALYTPWGSLQSSHYAGGFQTGMVICVGSSNFHLASHLIASLRRIHGSNVAIEIAYTSDDDLKP